MYFKFAEGKQKEFMKKAIAKAGSERKLSDISGIPKGSINSLKNEARNLSDTYALKLTLFLGMNLNELDFMDRLQTNWGQIKGGNELIRRKKASDSFNETIERLKKVSSRRMRDWHRTMKKENPEEYHILQYERFKKIGGGYKFSLSTGVKVRNTLERDVGNFLVKNFLDVKYEPYLNILNKVYFPDFVIGNVIVEVTGWKHPSDEKINKLNEKIKAYVERGYKICFFVPIKYRKFYKRLICSVISTRGKLREFIDASIA